MRWLLVVTALLFAGPPVGAVAEEPSAPRALFVNDGYDPRANPYRDLERAIDRASAENKRILIVVGGDWCTWCEILDRFLMRDAVARGALAESFVILKVNMSRENENAAFLSGFPASAAYPDFFILDSNGAYLGRQDTELLEGNRDYDQSRMLAFARRWQRG